jgi:hypothetical protein
VSRARDQQSSKTFAVVDERGGLSDNKDGMHRMLCNIDRMLLIAGVAVNVRNVRLVRKSAGYVKK